MKCVCCGKRLNEEEEARWYEICRWCIERDNRSWGIGVDG